MAIQEPVYLVAGVLFMAIGAALLVARRTHAPAVALAVYVGSLGFLYASTGFSGESSVGPVPAPLLWIAQFAAAGGLATLALIFPKRITGSARVDALAAGAYGIGFVVLLVWLGDATARAPRVDDAGWHPFLGWLGSRAIAAASIATGLLLPLRARRLGARDGDAMRAIGTIAVALFLLSPGGPWPGIVRAAQGEFSAPRAAMVVVNVAVPMAAWIAATTGQQSRGARNTWLALVALNLGLGALYQFTGELVVQIGRLMSAAFLTYGVIAGQIEGLDVKIRFAISRSTIAAAFVAAFFVASEGAQILFGQGNEWVGLLAAGALVFAIAPLQRAAERLAERAVPVAPAAGSLATRAGSRASDAYREVLRRYLRDGALTRDEERALAILAGELRLDAGRAFELREEVERELAAHAEVS